MNKSIAPNDRWVACVRRTIQSINLRFYVCVNIVNNNKYSLINIWILHSPVFVYWHRYEYDSTHINWTRTTQGNTRENFIIFAVNCMHNRNRTEKSITKKIFFKQKKRTATATASHSFLTERSHSPAFLAIVYKLSFSAICALDLVTQFTEQ